ncbi:MAG TPA: hypothetical protein VGM23_02485 [Armatimonadota bacterium]|jgi:hypothetical protein
MLRWLREKMQGKRLLPEGTEALEDSLLVELRTLPSTVWEKSLGGFTARLESGVTVVLQFWRAGSSDSHTSLETRYLLLVNGQQVAVNQQKLGAIYQALMVTGTAD